MRIGDSFLSLWHARSRREQILLLALTVCVAMVAAWYGVASPLRRAAGSAEAHHARAAQAATDVEAAVAEIAGSKGLATLPADGFEEAVLASAAASGLTLDRNRMENAREITIWANAAEPAALFNWIETLQQAHGVVVTNLTATRNEDGALQVEARLARGGS